MSEKTCPDCGNSNNETVGDVQCLNTFHTTNKVRADLTPEEIGFLNASAKCEACGHLESLHNTHCCEFCKVPDCRCRWGELEEDLTNDVYQR